MTDSINWESTPTTSHWQRSFKFPHTWTRTTSDLPPTANTVIIGSGLSGISFAYFLLCSSSENHSEVNLNAEEGAVVMLEARGACSGATSRNGGHCRPDPYFSYTEYKKKLGIEEALKVMAMERENLDLITEILKDLRVAEDCEFYRGRGVDIFLAPDVLEEARSALEEYSMDAPFPASKVEWLNQSDAQRISGISTAVGGATYPAASFYPYKFSAHLLSQALRKGLNLQTQTIVQSISPDIDSDGYWLIQTSRGSIRTKRIVHATNAYAPAILPELKDFLVPVKGTCMAVSSPNHSFVLGDSSLQGDKKSMIVYWGNGSTSFEYLIQRPDSEKTLIIGGGGHGNSREIDTRGRYDDDKLDDTPSQNLQDFPPKFFSNWLPNDSTERNKEAEIWSGIMGYTKDHLPIVGPIPNKFGQFASVGHNGHGMARVVWCAREAVKEIFGKSSELPTSFRWDISRGL